MRLNRDNGLNDHIFDLTQHLFPIVPSLNDMLFELLERPFGGLGSIFLLQLFLTILIRHVLICLFVDGIVCQMHKAFLQVFDLQRIFLSGESTQAVLVKVDYQWIV